MSDPALAVCTPRAYWQPFSVSRSIRGTVWAQIERFNRLAIAFYVTTFRLSYFARSAVSPVESPYNRPFLFFFSQVLPAASAQKKRRRS